MKLILPKNKVREILNKYKIKIKNDFDFEIRCLCPFHDDNTISFSINEETGLWNCFAECGAGNLAQLISRLENCSMKEAYEQLQGLGDILLDIQSRIKNHMEDPIVKSQSKKLVVDLPDTFYKYSDMKQCPQYLLNRLKWDTIQFFELGECNEQFWKNRIIIPVRYRGNHVGFITRDYSGESDRRYRNPLYWNIKKYLFNYDNISKSKRFVKYKQVIVVEGVFSVLSLYEKGFHNSVATFGAGTDNVQMDLLTDLGTEELIYCYDNDKAGIKALEKLKPKLKYFFKKIAYIVLPNGKDPNDLSREEFIEYFKKKIEIL